MDESILIAVKNALISGDKSHLVELTKQALSQGIKPEKILYEGLVPGMDVVGEKFKNDEFYIPEVILRAISFKENVNILRPLLMDQDIKTTGKVLIGTVQGDLHDVGKNLVSLMLEASGYQVIDLGVDISVQTFVEKAKEHNVDIVGLSALLTTTMPNMKKVIQALQGDGLRGKVKVIIGGAPVSQSFADQVGADAYGHDATDAVEKIRLLLS